MNEKAPIAVQLDVINDKNSVQALLTFRNISAEVAYLDKVKALVEGDAAADVFVVESTDGVRASYTGIRAKRPAPSLPDFLRLAPGEMRETTARLDSSYDFPVGRQRYQIQYRTFMSYPDRPGLFVLESNVVETVVEK